MKKKAYQGYTIIELLTAVGIIAILLIIGIPGFRAFIQNNRAITLTNNFVYSINYARSEAIKRGSPVTVCASNSTQTDCSNYSAWTNGWIIFLDPDGDGNIANSDDRIRLGEKLDSSASMVTTVDHVTFQPSGFLSTGNGNFTLSASGCEGNNGRQVHLSNTGRISLTPVSCI